MRGNITKRGKASWQLKFDLPSANGKRRFRYATVRGTRKDAERELARLLNAADSGTLPDPCGATVAEYLAAWLAAPKASPKTMERFGELSRCQIVPHLGAHSCNALSRSMFRIGVECSQQPEFLHALSNMPTSCCIAY